ncbi:LysR family transcriptional regulator [soil metagenome]
MDIIRGMDIRKIDLNLMLVFDALMHEGNLTRAGFRLGLSQPAMSHALGKLRKLSGDELFVRVPTGMEPTPFAQRIAATVHEGLEMLQTAITGEQAFDAATCDRTFQILMSDIGEMVYLPRMLAHFASVAPRANIRVIQLPREDYQEAFLSGEVDLAIGFLPALKAGFYQQRLFDDSYICLLRADHPRVGSTMTIEQFSAESHVMIEPAGSRYSSVARQTSTTTLIERFLADRGLSRRVALRVPHFTVVPEIVRSTDLIATLPGTVKNHLRPIPNIKMVPLPIDVPRFEVKQFWHQLKNNDIANRWLRGVVAELFTETPQGRAKVAA